jgi:methylenetetrahydromethanopterin dehydrogenase
MSRTVRVGVLKAGCMGSLPLIEFLVDERADRRDIEVLVSGSGAKLGRKQCETIAAWMVAQQPDFTVLIGPAQQAPGPTKARKMLVEAGVPTVVISDGPARKIVSRLEADGFGYIIIDADAMIGARREFLDPVEMALYNADMIRILAVTGVLRVITQALDDLIQAVQSGRDLKLPRLVVTKESAVASSGLINSYARAKAMASYEVARRVAGVDSTACFKVQEWTRYVPLVASGHEMIRAAAKLADDAREIEKAGDKLVRKPHYADGALGVKTKLMEKPRRSEKKDRT